MDVKSVLKAVSAAMCGLPGVRAVHVSCDIGQVIVKDRAGHTFRVDVVGVE